MKKFTSPLMLLFTTLIFAQTTNYNVGDIVDDFTVTDIYGVEHNLYEYADAGKHIYLDFFFDTCGPCQTWQPTFSEFYDKYGCNGGDLVMISINNGTDSDEEVLLYEETYGGPYNHPPAVSADGGSASVDSNFGVSAYPTFCLIGPDRTLLNRDIWPLTDITTFEATFPNGLEPEIMECTILGVTENQNVEFTVVPSISNGQNISLVMENQVAKTIQVFDLTGREVYSLNVNANNMAFSLNVSSGTYLVKVTTETSSATKKIIIR
jgi:thiol-disulfide isomerase/thioredoxin